MKRNIPITVPAPLQALPLQEFNAILAGLRILQHALPDGELDPSYVREIITTIAGDTHPPLTFQGIDALVEKLFTA